MPISIIFLLFTLFVVCPLFATFSAPRYQERRPVVLLVAVPLLLFLINAPLHEFAHMIGTWLGGGHVSDYNLVMRFWSAHPQVPMIVTSGLETVSARVTASFFPYATAAGFLLAGLLYGRRINHCAPWIRALFYLLFVLRPGFDIASNLVSHACFRLGDFNDLSVLVSRPRLFLVEAGLGLIVVISLYHMVTVAHAPVPSSSDGPLPQSSPPAGV